MAKRTSVEKPAIAPAASLAATPYVVFARRFRPRSFSDVVGQSATTDALRQALRTGRVAQAYLFCGPRGVGKTSLARIVAKALNCLEGKGPSGIAEEPCNTCAACQSIQEGSALDVIEMDAATNRGIEEVRALRDNVGISPAQLHYKVYIIDEVHMLTREAWNAFLKTLEEPPAHVKFIFATTDPNNVPETILSRCQRFDLRRIGPADIVMRLKQICDLDNISYEDAALSRIASLARGGLRDAEGLLDQAVNLGSGKVTDVTVRELSGAVPDELLFSILDKCAAANTAEALGLAHQALEAGGDPEDMLSAFIERLRAALLCKVCGKDSALLEGQAHIKEALIHVSSVLTEDQMLMLIQLFTAARRQMKDATQTRLPLEMALIRAARVSDLIDLSRLVTAIESSPAFAAPQGTGDPPRGPALPNREGVRPNSTGRLAEIVKPQTAQTPTHSPAKPVRDLSSSVSSASGSVPDFWSTTIAAISREKGTTMLASGLSHAASVRFDDAAGEVIVGFLDEQLFYKEALEKPQNQSLLKNALKQASGRDLTIRVERSTQSTTGRVLATTNAAQLRTAPAVIERHESNDNVPDELSDDETEIEFDTAGELPLQNDAIPESSAVETSAVLNPAQSVMTESRNRPVPAGDMKKYENHPLVKLVLKEVGGILVGASKR